MHARPGRQCRSAVAIALFVLFSVWAFAQNNAAPARITAAVEDSRLTLLRGNTHPLAHALYDRGGAAPTLPMDRMLLVLQRSPEQERALRTLLEDQQDKSSPDFHNWLTPEEFGQRFGPSDRDLQTVLSWLQSHGFQRAKVAKGRSVIEFSGTAAQVREAFHTEIHKYVVNAKEYWANASDPAIPAALTPVVAGVATLHNVPKKPRLKISEQKIAATVGGPGMPPQIVSSNGQNALGPGDFKVIYNITSDDAFGASIAVVARSNFNLSDVQRFRSFFNLPHNDPMIALNGPDPGNRGGDEEVEAVLDATWAGAIGPQAFVVVVVSASTNSTDGADLSELYIIDSNHADVITESFSGCEADVTSTEAIHISQLAEQAAAQGMTYIVGSGDTGSAGCDHAGTSQASGPVSVNVLASTPYTVAVGGTQFNEHGADATYWSTTNNQYTYASALSYIPENVWNESCAGDQCGQQLPNIHASGGGSSIYFSKPSWQTGVPGIPNDGMRDVPDVSFASSGSHHPYLLCVAGSCTPDSNGRFFFLGVGGTSVAAPAFAGIMAILHARVVGLNAHPRLGQVNQVLYQLAARQNLSSCNGSSTSGLPASTCIFNDVTSGNNAVPGESGYGTPDAKYQSGAGYDLASGLGSLNVTNLISNWSTVGLIPTKTSLTLNPTTFAHGTPVNVQIVVTSTNGVPAGDVSLYRSGISPGSPSQEVPGNFFTLDSSGSVSATTSILPGGYYSVDAHYAGDGRFAPSESSAAGLTVSPEASTTSESVLTIQGSNFVPFTGGPYGSFVYLRADVRGNSGVGYPTGKIRFADSGAEIPGSPYALNSLGTAASPNGVFTFTPGQHSLTATYGGDPSFAGSSSPAAAFNITRAPAPVVVSATGATQGANLSATISTGSGGNPPSGTVTFFAAGTQLGSPVTVTGVPATVNIQGGVFRPAKATATLLASDLANGEYNISATYSGDTNYVPSSAAPVTIQVQPDFTITASSPVMAIAGAGGTGSMVLTVGALDGFSGAVTFSCSGLPSLSSCQFSPATINASGNTTLTVVTTAPTARFTPAVPSNRPVFWVASIGAGFAGIFLIGMLPGRQRRNKLISFVLFAFVLSMIACGGGGSRPAPPVPVTPPPSPGTASGTYLVTITATSGVMTHTQGFLLHIG
jgi:hypothetical protein